MKFVVDEQLPRKLVLGLRSKGYEAIHADDIPHTLGKLSDIAICNFADAQDSIVITKDEDFWQQYLLMKKPKKLIYVTTGNIKNTDLFRLFEHNIDTLATHLEDNNVIEINQKEMIIHF